MKLITAMVRPDKLEAVQTAVSEPDAYVAYVSNVADVREPISGMYRGSRYNQPRPRMRIEIVVVNDRLTEDIVEAIALAASVSGSDGVGCGSLFVTPLDEWVHIPTPRPQPARELEAVGGISRRAS